MGHCCQNATRTPSKIARNGLLEQAGVNQLYNSDRVLYLMKQAGVRGDPVVKVS